MLFTEVDFLDRFGKAAKAGFKGVEYLFPYAWEADRLAGELTRQGLKQVLFNLPAGKLDAGERGIAVLSHRVKEFQEGVGRAIQYAQALQCPCVNCLVGLVPKEVPEKKFRKTLVENLRFAAAALEAENIRLLIEPLNRQDVPDFYLTCTAEALALIQEVDHRNLWLQYDIYHMQIMEGNLTQTLRNHIHKIAHIQLADNPGRHEPGTGEINFSNLFKFIDQAGYQGWIGCEYKPTGRTEDSLAFLHLDK